MRPPPLGLYDDEEKRLPAMDLVPPARRDVKSMTGILGDLKTGEEVTAKFVHGRYGVFTVRGPVFLSVGGGLTVGSLGIDSNRKPDKSLLSLAKAVTSEPGHDEHTPGMPAVHERALGVRHGQVVRACFEQKPYG